MLFYGLRAACAAFAWATWINLIDFVVRRLAESVSISGADIDRSGLDQVDFWRFEIPLFIENCMMLINLSSSSYKFIGEVILKINVV